MPRLRLAPPWAGPAGAKGGETMETGQSPAPRTVRFGATGLIVAGDRGPIAFVDAVLRGVGQVVFLNNAYAGLLCLLGILLAAPEQAAMALAGTAAGTCVAILLRAARDDIRAGLYGYNGCLVAIALPQFLGGGAAVWALALGTAGLSSALLLSLRGRTAWLPPLTAPFVLCSWAAIALVQAVGATDVGAARGVPVPAGIGWPMLDGVLSGIAQIFLQASPLSGAMIALALLVGSRVVFVLALLAGLASAGVASLIGVPSEAIRAGLFGFNAILAAIALGAVFLRTGGPSAGVALAAAALMPLFQTACVAVTAAVGLPAMSLPFILTTWVALSAARMVPALRAAM